MRCRSRLVSLILLVMQYPSQFGGRLSLVIGRLLLHSRNFNAALFRAHGKMHYEATVACRFGGPANSDIFKLQFGLGILAWLLHGCCTALAELLTSFSLLFTPPPPRSRIHCLRSDVTSRSHSSSDLFRPALLVYFYLEPVMLSKMAQLRS